MFCQAAGWVLCRERGEDSANQNGLQLQILGKEDISTCWRELSGKMMNLSSIHKMCGNDTKPKRKIQPTEMDFDWDIWVSGCCAIVSDDSYNLHPTLGEETAVPDIFLEQRPNDQHTRHVYHS